MEDVNFPKCQVSNYRSCLIRSMLEGKDFNEDRYFEHEGKFSFLSLLTNTKQDQAAAQVTEITTKKVDSKEEESIDEEEMVEEEIDDDFEDGSVDEPTEAVPVESNVPVV